MQPKRAQPTHRLLLTSSVGFKMKEKQFSLPVT